MGLLRILQFFKVSGLATEDIQLEMNYETLAESDVLVWFRPIHETHLMNFG
jgi:hypothetical protein